LVKYVAKPVVQKTVPLSPKNQNTSHLSGFGDSAANLSDHWDETFAESHAFEWFVRRPGPGAPLDPHLWSVEETAAWVEAIGLGEYSTNFQEHAVDGATLFYVTETELQHELGLVKVGLRKRFILARLWLSHAHRRAAAVREAAKRKLQGAATKINAVTALSPRSASAAGGVGVAAFTVGAAATTAELDPFDQMLLGGNAPEWQVSEMKQIRNVMGGVVAITELLISVLELHFCWHFVSLLPLVFAGFVGFLGYAKC
jgi:hypothetical protein